MARISTYPLAQPLDGTEQFISVQNSGSYKVTAEQLRIYIETGVLTGTVSKTLAPVGGDFATLNELFTWIGKTLMSNVELYISVQPGIYNIADAGTGVASYKLIASQLSKMVFTGDDNTTCYFNMGNSVAGKSFISATNSMVIIEDMQFNNSGEIGVIATLNNSLLTVENVIAPELDYICSATNGSQVVLTSNTIGCVNAGVKLSNSSTVLLSGGTMDGQGTAGPAVHGTNNTSASVRDNATISNFGTAFLAEDASKFVLSGSHTLINNIVTYNPPINRLQGDGGYIADGDLDASNAEITSNKNVADGYAGLDSSGKIPLALLPSEYGKEIFEYSSTASFPVTGESDILYIAIDSGIVYRWGRGTVETSPGSGVYLYEYMPIKADADAGEFQ